MYIVTYTFNTETFYLRGTILTREFERATVYPTAEVAQAAIVKAKPFQKARTNKNLTVVAINK